MKRPPPIPEDCGLTSEVHNPVEIAASTADPFFSKTFLFQYKLYLFKGINFMLVFTFQ